MRLLVVEDNKKLAGYLKNSLTNEGYSVDLALDGNEADRYISMNEYDLIVLDIMLPGKDGVTVCKEMRQKKNSTPILFLTAKGETDDKVNGLDSGGDDYLVKPFELSELFARVRALIRRPKGKVNEILKYKDIELNPKTHEVVVRKKQISLTLKEFQVLQYLIVSKGLAVTRAQIIDHCWDMAYDSFTNSVDVYIKRLRKKLSPNNYDKYIKTIRGVGYKLEE